MSTCKPAVRLFGILHFLLLSLFVLPEVSTAQQASVDGIWSGTFSQSTNTFDLELTIEQDGSNISGVSRAESDPYYAVMDFVGTVTAMQVTISEISILEENVPSNQRWCIKNLDLTLTGSVLEGTWEDPGCNLGTVRLEKVLPTAVSMNQTGVESMTMKVNLIVSTTIVLFTISSVAIARSRPSVGF